MSAPNAVVSAPATTEEYGSWHEEVFDKVAGAGGFEIDSVNPIAPDAVSFRLKMPPEAVSCCKIVALTEGGNSELFVTLKKPEAQA